MRGRSAAAATKAMRALLEGEPASFALVAEAAGRTEKYLRQLAKKEGWRVVNAEANPMMMERRRVTLSDSLLGEMEAEFTQGRASGKYDKSRIDALSSMLRMIEKLGGMVRVPERAAQEQNRSDAELAAALALIDARIMELACELAAALGGAGAEQAGTGVSDPG